jgi:hypothetical protein
MRSVDGSELFSIFTITAKLLLELVSKVRSKQNRAKSPWASRFGETTDPWALQPIAAGMSFETSSNVPGNF